MNKQILANSTEDFILKYRSALKAKLSREQFADYMALNLRTVDRKRQKIKQFIGLDLAQLPSKGDDKVSQSVLSNFENIVNTMAEPILKSVKVNSSDDKTTVNIQKNKRYLITSAQNATPVHTGFLKALTNYAQVNDAQLLVIPYRYKNPTSVWSNADKEHDWWHESLKPYLLDEELKVGKHIKIMGNIKMQPTAVSPLSGFDTVSDLDSAIFGHPNVEWKTIPSIPGKTPKILLTTGAITLPNYTDTKAGHKGAFHHTISAIVLEIDENELFHVRHLTADAVGNFYDLDAYYTHKSVERGEEHRALALIAGDIHAEVIDLPTRDALFLNADSVAAVVKPRANVLHDLIDSTARNHHIGRDGIGRFIRYYFDKNDNVEEGLQIAADFIDLISKPDTINVVVRSNHDEHVDRWLSEADPKTDPENAKFYHYLKYHQYDAIQNGEDFSLLEFWCSNPDDCIGLNNIENTVFLKRNECYDIAGVEISLHGDQGPNGSRGSLRNLSRMGQKLVVGHSHTPGIINGSYQVGTTSKLQLDYNKGPSSWLNTAAIIYPNGSVTLINVIDGKWKI